MKAVFSTEEKRRALKLALDELAGRGDWIGRCLNHHLALEYLYADLEHAEEDRRREEEAERSRNYPVEP